MVSRREPSSSRYPTLPSTPRADRTRRRRGTGLGTLVLALAAGVGLWIYLGQPTSLADLEALPPSEVGTTVDTLPDGQPDAAAAADLTAPPADAEGPFAVVRVVDGDTLIVARPEGDTRVRVIGIDTPESVAPDRPVECFGPESADRADQLLTGTSVMLRGDPTQDRVDQYGRELDYVWLPDGRLFNHVMLVEGFATEYTFAAPYAYQDSFRAAEQQAAQGGVGLWSPATCGGDVEG